MLTARPTNANVQEAGSAKDLSKTKSKLSNKLQNSTNTRRPGGLKVSNGLRIGLANKPKQPLHASTNTIHTQQQRRPANIKSDKKNKVEDDLIKKKTTVITRDQTDTKTVIPKIDENDISPFITDPYDPLLDVYPLDEELYQKVLKLELAPDGLPTFESDEPFDF